MPSSNESGRGWIRRGLSELVDRAFLGNRAHDFQSGYWNKNGAIQGGIAGIAGMVNPFLGLATSKGLDMYNRGPQGSGISGTFMDTGFPSGVQGTDMGYATIPNYGGQNPQVSVGQPQTASIGGYAPNVPTMPQVDAQGPYQSLGSGTGNLFSGGALGSWANGGGASGGLHYGNGAGAGTGYGGSSYANDAWGDVASGFGIGGMAGGSRDQAMSMYGPTGRKTRI